MNTKDLCEAIMAGEFGYKPNDDTSHIATQYLKLVELVEASKGMLPTEKEHLIDQVMLYDPAVMDKE